jgi:succinate--hydroxymethylglutarate CoA-transferase
MENNTLTHRTHFVLGLYAHGAIMASIIRRATTGLGQHIDCSLLDCQVASLANIASNYLVGNQEAQRMGTSHPSIVPYQVMPTKNSFVMIGAGNDGQFAKLCKAINREDLLQDTRFTTNGDRVKHRVELIKYLEDRLTEEDTEHWLEKLNGAGFPFAPINNIEQTFHHPQVLARGMIQEVDHQRAGKIKVVGIPVKYSESKPTIRLPPPVLGQHTNEILETVLGYKQTKISELRAEGVVGK